MAFTVTKPAVPEPQVALPARELLWSGLLEEAELTLKVPQEAMDELAAAAKQLAAQVID